MSSSPELVLNEQLGLLRAVCQRNDYFGPDEVTGRELPLSLAIERYGKEGVPRAGSIVYQTWGSQPIIAGMLDAPSSAAALPYLRCAAVAQQALGAKGVDMLVLLIGPEGTCWDEAWVRAAAAIEDDDRICRKLVWLPNGDAAASAERLLGRSPFARPWRDAVAIDAQGGAIDELIADEDELDGIAVRADAERLSAAAFVRNALNASQAG